MSSKMIFNNVETGLVVGSAVIGLSNIYQALGIILLIADLLLIIFKVYQAIKTSIAKKNGEGLEEAIDEAHHLIETLQEAIKAKEGNNGDNERTE